MHTAKQFTAAKRGAAAGMRAAKDLRAKLHARVGDLLYNAIAIMVEDFPADVPKIVATDPTDGIVGPTSINATDPWDYRVLSAQHEVFTHILTGEWVALPIGLAVRPTRGRYQLSVFAPPMLQEEFDGILIEDDRVIETDISYTDGPDYVEFLNESWLGFVLDTENLHARVCEQAAVLASSKSLVYNQHWRRHRKLIHSMKEGDDDSDDQDPG